MSRNPTTNRLTPDPDLARWCAVLSEGKPPDKVPDGWLTAKQLARRTNKAESTVRSQLCRAVADGKCERKAFRIEAGNGVMPIPHYRLK